MKLITVLTACLALVALPVAADNAANADQAWLGLSLMDFQYKEFSDRGVLLDREDGPVPGIRLSGFAHRGGLLVGIEGSYLSGRVDYDGQLQDGRPHRTRTDETFVDVRLHLGRQLTPASKVYLGGGFRLWDRDILPSGGVAGLFERYTWLFLLAGGEQLLWQGGGHRFSLDAQLTYPLNPTMALNLDGSGEVTLDLGSRPGLRLVAPWRLRLASGRRLEVAPFYEYWQLGRSPDVTVGYLVIHEPRSETSNFGVTLSLGF